MTTLLHSYHRVTHSFSIRASEQQESDRELQGNCIVSLSQSNIKFSARPNSIKETKKKKGKSPTLIDGVKVVPAGAAYIIELQEKNYAYLRP